MVKGIRHTGIVVADMDKAMRFYRDLLGLQKVVFDAVVHSEFHDRLTALPRVRIHVVMLAAEDGHFVELLQYLSHPRKPPDRIESCDVGCSHIAFTVSGIDALYEKMTAAGIHFNYPPQLDERAYAKVAYAHDYEGTIVELVEIVDRERTPYAD